MSEKQTYQVTFDDTIEVYTEEGLQNFVKTAVVHNKDISRFSVERVGAPEPSELTVEDLLNDCGARAIRMAALAKAPVVIIDAMHIAVNLKKVIERLGYGENSKN